MNLEPAWDTSTSRSPYYHTPLSISSKVHCIQMAPSLVGVDSILRSVNLHSPHLYSLCTIFCPLRIEASLRIISYSKLLLYLRSYPKPLCDFSYSLVLEIIFACWPRCSLILSVSLCYTYCKELAMTFIITETEWLISPIRTYIPRSFEHFLRKSLRLWNRNIYLLYVGHMRLSHNTVASGIRLYLKPALFREQSPYPCSLWTILFV